MLTVVIFCLFLFCFGFFFSRLRGGVVWVGLVSVRASPCSNFSVNLLVYFKIVKQVELK